jgi:hypothetical protein
MKELIEEAESSGSLRCIRALGRMGGVVLKHLSEKGSLSAAGDGGKSERRNRQHPQIIGWLTPKMEARNWSVSLAGVT